MRALLLLPLLAACAAPVTPQGRWAGTVTPAAPSDACKPSRGVAQLRDGALLFAPDEGVWILTGTGTREGYLSAERSRAVSGRTRYETKFTGRWTQEAITGTYTTPRCSFAVSLQRTR